MLTSRAGGKSFPSEHSNVRLPVIVGVRCVRVRMRLNETELACELAYVRRATTIILLAISLPRRPPNHQSGNGGGTLAL